MTYSGLLGEKHPKDVCNKQTFLVDVEVWAVVTHSELVVDDGFFPDSSH